MFLYPVYIVLLKIKFQEHYVRTGFDLLALWKLSHSFVSLILLFHKTKLSLLSEPQSGTSMKITTGLPRCVFQNTLTYIKWGCATKLK